MNEIIKGLLASWIRKIIFGAGMVWVTYIVEKGIANTSDIERFIDILVAALLILVPALCTIIKNKWFKQESVIVPKEAVMEVKAIVAAAK